MKTNYQLVCDRMISEIAADGRVPKLLLHSCCGPCSTYVLEYLTKFFQVTLLFYNPNIFPQEEFEKRLSAQREVIEKLRTKQRVSLLVEDYDHAEFLSEAIGAENEPEGGRRCEKCFRVRLKKTAELAKKHGFDVFATTLSVSPHKNAELLNQIGKALSEEYEVPFLFSDFKKREGYKRSVELSKEFGIYRQEYCGCEFSIRSEDL